MSSLMILILTNIKTKNLLDDCTSVMVKQAAKSNEFHAMHDGSCNTHLLKDLQVSKEHFEWNTDLTLTDKVKETS